MSPNLLKMAMQGQSDPGALIEAMLNRPGLSDSRKDLLRSMLAQQRAAASEPVEAEAVELDPEPDRDARTHEVLGRAERIIAEAQHRITELEELIAGFAEAVGACPDCFGADPGCPTCDGDGRPGRFAPDRQAFAYYVLPVISRMKRSRPQAKAPESSRTVQQKQTLERST